MNHCVKGRIYFDNFIECAWGCEVGYDAKVEGFACGWIVFPDLVGFGLGSDYTADGNAFGEELGEDVSTEEAIAAGKKNSFGHFWNILVAVQWDFPRISIARALFIFVGKTSIEDEGPTHTYVTC